MSTVWGSFKSIIGSGAQPQQPAPVQANNRRPKRNGDVQQDAKALQKTQRTALGDISNRADGTQAVAAKRATRAATKPASEAPMIPAPPVPKMNTVYAAAPTAAPAVVPVDHPLVVEAKVAAVPQALASPGTPSAAVLSPR